MLRTPSGVKPGSARSSRSKLRTTRPPVVSRISDSATCATTMPRRIRPCPPPPRTALLASSDESVDLAAHDAGAIAARRPSATPTPTITAPIPQSTTIDSRRGRASGARPPRHPPGSPVDAECFSAPQIKGPQRHERARPPDPRERRRDAARQTEQRALEHHGPDDGHAVGAERARYRELVFALRRPRQQH